MKTTQYFIAFVLVIFIQNKLFSQDSTYIETPRLQYTSLSMAYIFGGQLYNDTFIYNAGYKVSITQSIAFSPDLNLGLGMSYMPLQNERFIPIYIDLISFKNEMKNSKFLNVQLGYAHAWNMQTAYLENYDFKGGIYLSAGSGKKIVLHNTTSLLISWSYNHQFANMAYTLPGGKPYKKTLNYDMFSLSTAIQF